jgi:hypothetical protein
MILKDSIRSVQSEYDQEQWYMSVTKAALYIAIGGFIDDANRLLEGLWKQKIPHSRNTWLPDIGFEMLWHASGKRPVNAPFPKADIDQLELSHRDYLISPYGIPFLPDPSMQTFYSKAEMLAGTKEGKLPDKKNEVEALRLLQLYFENTTDNHPYQICKGLSLVSELASKNNEADIAIEYLRKWAGKFDRHPFDSAVVLVACNRHAAPLLLNGAIADELHLSKAICEDFVSQAIATIDNRMKNGSSLVYGDLSWAELLKKLSELAIKSDPELFSEEQKENGWIGREPAKSEMIEDAEKRLGLKLPGDYKEFLKQSNGFSEFGYVRPGLFSIAEVDLLKTLYKGHEDIFEIMKSYPGKDYANNRNDTIAEYLERAVAISPTGEQEIWLIPPSENATEWQCWDFNLGEWRFKSFRHFIEMQIQMLKNYI